MDSNANLKQLIEQSCAYDHDAFRAIFEMHVDRLFNYALSRTNDREAAKDITQETFIAVWESLDSFAYKGEEAFLGFIFVILKRRIVQYYRAQAREKAMHKEIHEEAHEEIHEDYRHLLSALGKLSSKYQDVVKLRYWGALSFAEIGATLGIRENAARTLHHRAIKKLQEVVTTT